jgi:integrase
MPTLRVQTSARALQVRLYTRGRAPACWHYCFSFHGRHRGSTNCTDLPAAQTAARQAVLDVVARTAVAGSMPLPAAISAYLAGRWPGLDTTRPRHALPRHYCGADERLNRFADWTVDRGRLGRPAVSSLHAPRSSPPNLAALTLDQTTALIQAFLDHRKDTCAARTILNDARALSAFFAYLLRTADLKALLQYRENPADLRFLTIAPAPSRPKPPAADVHVAELLEHGRRSTAWPAVLLCLCAGFRPIGASRVRWADLDLDAGQMGVEEKNVRRHVPLPRWVIQELRAWRRAHPTDETLCPPERHKVHWALKQLRKKLGLPDNVTLQSLRRSFISRCMDHGIGSDVVAGVAGNSPAVIARHYKQLGTLKASKVVSVMENLPQNLPHAKSAKVVTP